MIPKVIHYFWFGGKPLTELACKCIASWKRYLPDYEICRWDESNFDVNIISYTRDAYAAGKYAFVSDYARFRVLYDHGGVYFDTDVEVIKPMDDILSRGPYMGFESLGKNSTIAVAPGLGMAAEAGMELFADILLRYESLTMFLPDGRMNPVTMIPMVTQMLLDRGLNGNGDIESAAGFIVYPPEWFNPFDDATGRLNKTVNTRSIHWYSKSWMTRESKLTVTAKRLARRLFGVGFISRIGKLFK